MPIDPSFAVAGPEWRVDDIAGPAAGAAGAADGDGFAGALAGQIKALSETQAQASEAARGLATGTSASAEEAVMAIERARLAMQLASTIRTKAVDAVSDLLHTQI